MHELNRAESAKTAAGESSCSLTLVAKALRAVRTCLTRSSLKEENAQRLPRSVDFRRVEEANGAETRRARLKSGSRRLYTAAWDTNNGVIASHGRREVKEQQLKILEITC